MGSFSGPPYLSVVVTARNDDHGKNLLARMQTFVNALISQCRRHRVPTELIMIEWNPPLDRPRLAEALTWPDDEGWCPVRILEVPIELHRRWASWQALPLYQMIGKNVGIRRAHGEFVLATNVDVLFSDELMRFMGERRLDPGKMYRVDRWDVMADVPVNAPVEEQLAYCGSHLIRLNAREGTFRVGNDGLRVLESNDIAAEVGPVKLGAGWFHRELSGEEPFRWVNNDAELILTPSGEERILVLDVEPGPGVAMGTFLLELQDSAGNRISDVRVKRRTVVTFTLPTAAELARTMAAGADGRGRASGHAAMRDTVQASSPETIRVRLHTRNGGERIATDTRTLNFRLFSCRLEAPSALARLTAAEAEAPASVRGAASRRSRLGRGLRLAREIWRGNPNAEIRLPMSRDRLSRLRLRQDDSGISFSAQALRGRSGGGIGGELLPVGMRAVWGAGWLPTEYFAGETFRWMGLRASVIWILPPDPPPVFVLEVEPGPAVGFKACQLEIRNQWDEVMSTHPLEGRTRIEIPTDGLRGPLVTSLCLTGGGPSQTAHGDPRFLALRFLGCTWGGKSVRNADQAWWSSRDPIGVGPGTWCTEGWERLDGRRESAIVGVPGAELIVRAPGANRHVLTLEVAPVIGTNDGTKDGINEAGGKDPVDLVVEDPFGCVLFKGQIDSPQQIRVGDRFLGGNDYALRFTDGRADAPKTDEPWLALSAIEWESVPGETQEATDQVRIALRWTRSYSATLHTNGCGDFTMLAKERWLDLRGYAEMDLFAMNLDSLFCYAAHHGGAREEVLEDPMRVYHIEHGAGWTPEGERKLFDRIAAKGLSWLDAREILEWARVMHRFDAPMIFNREDWGLAGEELKETVPQPTKTLK